MDAKEQDLLDILGDEKEKDNIFEGMDKNIVEGSGSNDNKEEEKKSEESISKAMF